MVAESDAYKESENPNVSWREDDQSFVNIVQEDPLIRTIIPTKCYAYDAAGRLASVTLPKVPDPDNGGALDHPVYVYKYDAYGNQALIRDPNEHETSFEYDARGNQTSRQLPLGPDDRIDDFTETKVYNDLGQLDYEISFEGIVTDYVYDTDLDTYPTVDENGDPVPLDGNPLDPGDAGRLVAVYYFDNATEHANWLSDPLTYTPDESVKYTYDAFGRTRTVVQDPDLATADDERTTETEYDEEGRTLSIVTSEWITTSEGLVLHEGRVNYEYDPVTGDRTRTTSGEEGSQVTDTAYTYDSLGRLTTVTDADDLEVGYEYDLSGNLARTSQPGDVYTDYIYDDLNRLSIQRTWKDTDDDAEYDSVADQILAEFDYTLRADGKRESVHEKQFNPTTEQIDEAITNWEYDALGRLISESFDFEADGTIDRIDSYEFDLASNRKTKKVDGNADGDYDDPGDSETTYVYDVKDRLLSETFDAPGTDDDRYTVYEYGFVEGDGLDEPDRHLKTQQTKKTVRNSSGTVIAETDYTYNRQGRLEKVETTAAGLNPEYVEDYEYNADGIRVKKTVTQDADTNDSLSGETPHTTLYLIDPQNHTGYAQILEEFDVATEQPALRYTLGHDVVSQKNLVTPNTLFLLYDGHGSTRGLVNSLGEPLSNQVFRYDAYGNRMDNSIAATSLLYSGEKTDLTGLQYLRARYYDPSIGRLLRDDPFGGDLNDPVSLHKYLYTHADPVNLTDPSGLYPGFVSPIARRLLGTAVHSHIGNHFKAGIGLRWANQEIRTIIGDDTHTFVKLLRVFPLTMKPDLAEKEGNQGIIYEIKPGEITRALTPAFLLDAAEALPQLWSYRATLNAFSRTTTWEYGIEHYIGLRTWNDFTLVPGWNLVTFSDYSRAPGVLLYDFVPTPEAQRIEVLTCGVTATAALAILAQRAGFFAAFGTAKAYAGTAMAWNVTQLRATLGLSSPGAAAFA